MQYTHATYTLQLVSEAHTRVHCALARAEQVLNSPLYLV